MPNEQLRRHVDRVREALDRAGFEDLAVTHYDNTPPGHVVLHDDHGRLALGDAEEVERIILKSDDPEALWSSLDRAGMVRRTLAHHP